MVLLTKSVAPGWGQAFWPMTWTNLAIQYKELNDEYEVTEEYTVMEYEYESWLKLYRRYYEDYKNETDIFYTDPECTTEVAKKVLSIAPGWGQAFWPMTWTNLAIQYKELNDEYEVTEEYTVMEYEYGSWLKLYRRYYEDYKNETDIFYTDPECTTEVKKKVLSI